MSKEIMDEAIYRLQRIANAKGNETNPCEDVIDIAQAVLILLHLAPSEPAQEQK